MSQDATIRSGIQYVQAVFKQVALLLQTADQLVGEEGFSSAYQNTCLDDMAYTVHRSGNWLPHTAYRFYTADDMPRVLLVVAVLLDDRYDKFEPMNECLLTACAFISKGAEWDSKEWRTWWARWHGYHAPRHDDGRVLVVESTEWPEDDEDGKVIEKLFTVGRPLPEVKSTAELKALLAPLLAELAPYRGAAKG